MKNGLHKLIIIPIMASIAALIPVSSAAVYAVNGINGNVESGAYDFVYPDWDVNCDGVCNIGDITVICSGNNWGKTGAPGWIRSDVNKDGIVDQKDVDIVSSHFGESSSPGNTISITTASLSSGTVGTAYSADLAASGGSGSYTWSLSSGTLPAGLSLSSGGVISGTPTASGSSTFTVMVTDSSSATANQSLILVINNAGSSAAISVSPVSNTINAEDTFDVQILINTGSTNSRGANFSVSFDSSLLQCTGWEEGSFYKSWAESSNCTTLVYPEPVIDNSTGEISSTAVSIMGAAAGGPSGNGTLFTLHLAALSGVSGQAFINLTGVNVADQNGRMINDVTMESSTITINNAAISITTASLNSGTVGSAYSTTLTASGGSGGYTWSKSSGTLPAGLSLSSGGVISGTPTASGSSTFTIVATDSSSATASQSLTLVINNPAVSIITTSLNSGTVGTAYSANLAASGGNGSYTWSKSSGTLPAGLSLSTAGVISGTPTTANTYTFTVAAADSNSASTTKQLSLTINAAVMITTSSLSSGTVGSAYSATLATSGGSGSYTWTIDSGALPAGLSLSAAGVISGTPTAANTCTITVKATDSNNATATRQLSLVINAAVTITTSNLSRGTVGTAYSATLAASGGSGSYTWTKSSGTLPAGLSLSSGGVISGTPTASGSSTFTVTATDSSSATASKSYTLVINAGGSATISVSPVSNTIDAEDTFDIQILINTGNINSRGANLTFSFDPAYLKCTGWEEGSFYKSWAQGHSCSTMVFPSPNIDNINGKISSTGIAVMGNIAGGPAGSGTLFTFHMAALSDVNGQAFLKLIELAVSDQIGNAIKGVTAVDGTVTISNSSNSSENTSASSTDDPPLNSDPASTPTTTDSRAATSSSTSTITSTGAAASRSAPTAAKKSSVSAAPSGSTSGFSDLAGNSEDLISPIVMAFDLEGINDYQDGLTEDFQVENNADENYNLKVTLGIAKNTLALDGAGLPLKTINVVIDNPVTDSGDGNTILYTLDCGPDGSTFSIPINLAIQYDPASIPDGIAEKDLVMCWYDMQNEKWVAVDSHINPYIHTIIARINHFSTYAVMSQQSQAISWALFSYLVMGIFVLCFLAAFYLFRRKKAAAYVYKSRKSTLLLPEGAKSSLAGFQEELFLFKVKRSQSDRESLKNIRNYLGITPLNNDYSKKKKSQRSHNEDFFNPDNY